MSPVTVTPPSMGGIIASQCSNLRSPMLNSLREWGERRSTRVFREKAAKNVSSFEPVCIVTKIHKEFLIISQNGLEIQADV